MTKQEGRFLLKHQREMRSERERKKVKQNLGIRENKGKYFVRLAPKGYQSLQQ